MRNADEDDPLFLAIPAIHQLTFSPPTHHVRNLLQARSAASTALHHAVPEIATEGFIRTPHFSDFS